MLCLDASPHKSVSETLGAPVEVYQSQRLRNEEDRVYLWRLEMVARFQQPVAATLLHHRQDFVIDYNTFGERIYL